VLRYYRRRFVPGDIPQSRPRDALQLVDIRVPDHLILAEPIYSFAARRLL
jgi:hypothetical protein